MHLRVSADRKVCESLYYGIWHVIYVCVCVCVCACACARVRVCVCACVCVCVVGFQASPQDRFLVMAAEMESSGGAGVPELAQFWKGVSKAKVMEHRWRLSHTRCILGTPALTHEYKICTWTFSQTNPVSLMSFIQNNYCGFPKQCRNYWNKQKKSQSGFWNLYLDIYLLLNTQNELTL